MTTEIVILKARDVFEIVPRPKRQNIVRSKWIYANK